MVTARVSRVSRARFRVRLSRMSRVKVYSEGQSKR